MSRIEQKLSARGYKTWLTKHDNTAARCPLCDFNTPRTNKYDKCRKLACAGFERAMLGRPREYVVFIANNPMGLARGAALVMDGQLEGMI